MELPLQVDLGYSPYPRLLEDLSPRQAGRRGITGLGIDNLTAGSGGILFGRLGNRAFLTAPTACFIISPPLVNGFKLPSPPFAVPGLLFRLPLLRSSKIVSRGLYVWLSGASAIRQAS